MTIRKTGGHNTSTEASVTLRDDSGHRVEVVARLEYSHGRTTSQERDACRMTLPDPKHIVLEVRDLGQAAAEVVTEPQATLATDLSKAVAALSEVEGLGEKEAQGE